MNLSLHFPNTKTIEDMTDDDLTVSETDSIMVRPDETELAAIRTDLQQCKEPIFGTTILQAIATLVSGFVTSVWFAFSIQIILFSIMNIIGYYTPLKWTDTHPVYILGACIAGAPLLCDSLARVMIMSWACTVDCWKGMCSHPSSLWKSSSNGGQHMECVYLIFFFGIPLMICAISTFGTKSQLELGLNSAINDHERENQRSWYELTMLAWAASVCAFQIIYMELCWWNELMSCHQLLLHYKKTKSILKSIQINILLTQQQKYSGMRKEHHLLKCSENNHLSHVGNGLEDSRCQPVQITYSFGTRVTKFLQCCYKNLETKREEANEKESECETKAAVTSPTEPKQNYTVDEIVGCHVIVRKENWSLENLMCFNPKRKNFSTILNGESGVSQCQTVTGYFCVGITILLLTLALIGLMIAFPERASRMLVAAILLSFVGCLVPKVLLCIKVKGKKHDQEDDQDGTNEGADSNHALVSVWKNIRITELKEWACYATAAIEIIILVLLPLITLFAYKNTPIGVVFLVLAIHWVPMHYFNASCLLKELGNIDALDQVGPLPSIPPEKNANCKLDRLSVANLLQRVTRCRGHRYWCLFFGAFFVFCLSLFHLGSAHDYYVSADKRENLFKRNKAVYASGFLWDPQHQRPNPICKVEQGFSFPGDNPSSSLGDYAFLTIMTYLSHEDVQPLLDQYFGKGIVVNDYEFVQDYRLSTGTQDHPVNYKLFTFPKNSSYGIVGITGTESMIDWLVDGQIWLGAAFVETIRNINPLGWLWEPILDEVVYLINSVQSEQLKDVSYYQLATAFVEDLYSGYGGRAYQNLRTTGHSLGGGVAGITAAVTGASAITFSAPNAMYSRRTISPPITEEQLNTRVINTVPQRDMFGNLDKPGMRHQEILCHGPENTLMPCHSYYRSHCEIQYQCGSHGRPINCWCVSDYGYPKPQQTGNVTWEEACANEILGLGY